MSPRRLRLILLAAGLVAAALVLGAWTQPWAELQLIDGRDLSVRGQDAAPALAGIALAAVALTAALMIARAGLRIVLGILQLALGALAATLIAPLVFSMDALERASWPVISEATGVAGGAAIYEVQNFMATAWSIVAFWGAVLLGVVGLAVALTSRRWPTPTTKYDTAAERSVTETGAWDALSDGEDPTSR